MLWEGKKTSGSHKSNLESN